MTRDETLDWFERLLEWVEDNRQRATIYLLLAAVAVVGMSKCHSATAASFAQYDADRVAVAKHVAWLRGLPETDKRKWPVKTYCRPASGVCECNAYGDEVPWPERFENGDIACHVQK